MIGRRLAAAAVVASVAVALCGCAPERDAGWSPVTWPVYGAVLTSAPDPLVGEPAVTTGMRVRNDTVRIDARFAFLPGPHPHNDAVVRIVRDAVSAQELDAGTSYRPQAASAAEGIGERGCAKGATDGDAGDLLGPAPATHTVVVCDIVHSAGDVFGQRLRVVRGSLTEVLSDVTTTLYADTRTGTVATARDLIADPAVLWDDVVEVLRREAGSLAVNPVGAPTPEDLALLEPALTSATFTGGAVVLPLPVGFTAPALEGLTGVAASTPGRPVFVALQPAAVAHALTPFGRVVANSSGPLATPAAAASAVDCSLLPCIAVTLDDGPSELTPGILDVLRDRHAAATFYMLGQNARSHPDLVRRVAAEGHQIGNHTWNHSYLTELDDAGIRSQLDSTASVLRELSGQPVTTFRPPGGFISDHVLAVAGQTAVMWSIDTRDWAGVSDDALLHYTVEAPLPGAIVLLHDIQPGTARIFDDVVSGLQRRGFELVTVDALFGGAVPPGIVRRGP